MKYGICFRFQPYGPFSVVHFQPGLYLKPLQYLSVTDNTVNNHFIYILANIGQVSCGAARGKGINDQRRVSTEQSMLTFF